MGPPLRGGRGVRAPAGGDPGARHQRVEASLILIEAEYTSAHRVRPELKYSPFEIGLGRLVAFEKEARFTGRRAAGGRAGGGPARRLVGLELDWSAIEAMYARHGLAPQISPTSTATRSPCTGRASRSGARRRSRGGRRSRRWSASARWTGAHRSGNARVRRVDRGGRARQGRRDGGADAVPRPRAQAYLARATTPIHRIVCERLDRDVATSPRGAGARPAGRTRRARGRARGQRAPRRDRRSRVPGGRARRGPVRAADVRAHGPPVGAGSSPWRAARDRGGGGRRRGRPGRPARDASGPAADPGRDGRGPGCRVHGAVARAYHPDRSGDLQLLVAPFNSANYPQSRCRSSRRIPDEPRQRVDVPRAHPARGLRRRRSRRRTRRTASRSPTSRRRSRS